MADIKTNRKILAKTEEVQKKGNKFINEFKEFVSRGNVIDLAVGVIIGSSFTDIVNSLVNDVFMPFIGLILGSIDFTGLKYVITPAHDGVAETAIYYGRFIQNWVNFVIVAFVLFITVKAINKFNRKKEKTAAKAAEPSEEVKLLTEIRDLMKEKK